MKFGFLVFLIISQSVHAQDPYQPDHHPPKQINGMQLAWNDEFNTDGKPDPKNWTYERGFVRNQELQWYQEENVRCLNGVLLFEAKRENKPNPLFKADATAWRSSRQTIAWSSASIKTQGLQQFQFGHFEVRARIDTASGSWPAIWTLGTGGHWPLSGEVDIMEFYRVNDHPTILANVAWGRTDKGGPVWNTTRTPFTHFTAKDADWAKKFHVWRMDWTKDSISLYLDDELLNTQLLNATLNPDGSNPFLQPQYLLLNLAVGANGGIPAADRIKYEVDYVRYYQNVK